MKCQFHKPLDRLQFSGQFLTNYTELTNEFEHLLNDSDIADDINFLAIISNKYEMFASRLFNQIPIELPLEKMIEKIQKFRVLPDFPVFISLKRHENYISPAKIKKSKSLRKIILGNTPLDQVTKYTLNKILTRPEVNTQFRITSITSRLLGLWLWDKTKSPMNNNPIKIVKAIEELHLCDTSLEDMEDSHLRRILQKTEECIKEGTLLAFNFD